MSDEIAAGLIGAGAALIGAFIGAYVGYKFNEKLEANRVIERRQVQTKNIIFSPIYKQLIGLKIYLQERQDSSIPTFEVNFDHKNYSSYPSYTFDIWENIKGTIRKLYVPEDMRNELELLTKELRDHMKLQEEVRVVMIELGVEFTNTHKDHLKAKGRWNPRLLGINLSDYSSGAKYAHIRNDIIRHLRANFEFDEKEAEKYGAILLKQVDKHKAQKRLVNSFNQVIETVARVSDSFEKLIDDIIKKYEGGDHVQ